MGNSLTEKTWQQISLLQEKLSKTSNCYDAYAIEETLNGLLEELAKGETLTEKQIRNMQRDRWRKEHKRRAIISNLSKTIKSDAVTDSNLLLFELKRRLTPQNRRLILQKACGYSYAEMAESSNGSNPAGIKKRVSRIREQLVPLAA